MPASSSLSIWNTARGTTVSALHTVATVANTVTAVTDSVLALAETGSAYAQAYRDTAREDINEHAFYRRTVRVHNARLSIAAEIDELEQRLAKNPRLLEIFNSLDDRLAAFSKPQPANEEY